MISPKLIFSQNQTRPTTRVRILKLRYSHVSEFQSMFSLAFRTRRYSIEYEYEYHFIEYEYDKSQNSATSKTRTPLMHADLACSMACRAARILKHLAMENSSGAHWKFKTHQRAIPYNGRHYFSLFSRCRIALQLAFDPSRCNPSSTKKQETSHCPVKSPNSSFPCPTV